MEFKYELERVNIEKQFQHAQMLSGASGRDCVDGNMGTQVQLV